MLCPIFSDDLDQSLVFFLHPAAFLDAVVLLLVESVLALWFISTRNEIRNLLPILLVHLLDVLVTSFAHLIDSPNKQFELFVAPVLLLVLLGRNGVGFLHEFIVNVACLLIIDFTLFHGVFILIIRKFRVNNFFIVVRVWDDIFGLVLKGYVWFHLSFFRCRSVGWLTVNTSASLWNIFIIDWFLCSICIMVIEIECSSLVFLVIQLQSNILTIRSHWSFIMIWPC